MVVFYVLGFFWLPDFECRKSVDQNVATYCQIIVALTRQLAIPDIFQSSIIASDVG